MTFIDGPQPDDLASAEPLPVEAGVAALPANCGPEQSHHTLEESGPALQETVLELRESKQALVESDHELRESSLEPVGIEVRYQLLVDSVTDYAIYLLDPEGQVMTWNVGAERSKGYKAAEVLGRNFSIFFLPEDVEAGLPADELETAGEPGKLRDRSLAGAQGRLKFWALVTLTSIRDPKGALRGFAK